MTDADRAAAKDWFSIAPTCRTEERLAEHISRHVEASIAPYVEALREAREFLFDTQGTGSVGHNIAMKINALLENG